MMCSKIRKLSEMEACACFNGLKVVNAYDVPGGHWLIRFDDRSELFIEKGTFRNMDEAISVPYTPKGK